MLLNPGKRSKTTRDCSSKNDTATKRRLGGHFDYLHTYVEREQVVLVPSPGTRLLLTFPQEG